MFIHAMLAMSLLFAIYKFHRPNETKTQCLVNATAADSTEPDLDQQRWVSVTAIMKSPTKKLATSYTAQTVPIVSEVNAQRFRFFRVGSEESASEVANSNVGSDMGLLVYIYGPGPKFSGAYGPGKFELEGFDFHNSVVGEYYVDVCGHNDNPEHADLFGGDYQRYDKDGKDQDALIAGISLANKPGFKGNFHSPGFARKDFFTGGWYSLPHGGLCESSCSSKGDIFSSSPDIFFGSCSWFPHTVKMDEVFKPRLVKFTCLQEQLFSLFKDKFTDEVKQATDPQEQWRAICRLLVNEKPFSKGFKYTSDNDDKSDDESENLWARALQVFLRSFKLKTTHGGCVSDPLVATNT